MWRGGSPRARAWRVDGGVAPPPLATAISHPAALPSLRPFLLLTHLAPGPRLLPPHPLRRLWPGLWPQAAGCRPPAAGAARQSRPASPAPTLLFDERHSLPLRRGRPEAAPPSTLRGGGSALIIK